MKQIICAGCALALSAALCIGLTACNKQPAAETVIPARDNTGFSVNDVVINELPVNYKDATQWTPDDRYVLLGQDAEHDMAVYGLLKTEEGGAVEGDVGIVLRDGTQLQYFNWSYYKFGTIKPTFTVADWDGDGDPEAALSVHIGSIQTLYVWEKNSDGLWEHRQFTKTRLAEIIQADTAVSLSDDRKVIRWRAGKQEVTLKAEEYYSQNELSYDAAATHYEGLDKTYCGDYAEIEYKDGRYWLAYPIAYSTHNGSYSTMAFQTTLYACINYHADGTFSLSDYYFSAG